MLLHWTFTEGSLDLGSELLVPERQQSLPAGKVPESACVWTKGMPPSSGSTHTTGFTRIYGGQVVGAYQRCKPRSLGPPYERCRTLQGYLAHMKMPNPLGTLWVPGPRPADFLWTKYSSRFLMGKVPMERTQTLSAQHCALDPFGSGDRPALGGIRSPSIKRGVNLWSAAELIRSFPRISP